MSVSGLHWLLHSRNHITYYLCLTYDSQHYPMFAKYIKGLSDTGRETKSLGVRPRSAFLGKNCAVIDIPKLCTTDK